MKVFNPQHSLELPVELKNSLQKYRLQRGFDARLWVKAKSFLLNNYMRRAKLNTAVVAVSGGVDSALVLALVSYASKQPDSPIKKIVPVTLPALNNVGATNQSESLYKAQDLCLSLGLELLSIDVSPIQQKIISVAQTQLSLSADDWAKGQTVAYARTPVLYGITSILSSNGFSSIICGTTNRDEGAYLGYVGKASDGMVDVQLISDLHKSEVYSSAKELAVPQSILQAVCTGDMYDGRSDVEVFGASYDFVELYLWYLNTKDKEIFLSSLTKLSRDAFERYAFNLENLHNYNAHKYLAGSPAVHLDILESNVVGGWQIQENKWLKELHAASLLDTLNFKDITLLPESNCSKNSLPHSFLSDRFQVVDNIFAENTLNDLLTKISQTPSFSINSSGSPQVSDSYMGKSKRFSIYSRDLSQLIWSKISCCLSPIEELDEFSSCEVKTLSYFKPVGVNPYIKINQYEKGGFLVPHYDGAYEYNEIHKNMKTIVIYLEDNQALTRIIDDQQNNLPYGQRNHQDWPEDRPVENILFEYPSVKNTALIFQNKLLHDSTPVTTGRKTIILTEIVYERL